MTFDVTQEHLTVITFGWQRHYEVFAICRSCLRSTVFVLSASGEPNIDFVKDHGILRLPNSADRYVYIEGFINISNVAAEPCPDHVPGKIKAAFDEGAKCLAFDCYNAAATMFRLALDLATRPLVPDQPTPG